MPRDPQKISAGGAVVLLLSLATASILEEGLVSGPGSYRWLYVTVPLLLLALLAPHRHRR